MFLHVMIGLTVIIGALFFLWCYANAMKHFQISDTIKGQKYVLHIKVVMIGGVVQYFDFYSDCPYERITDMLRQQQISIRGNLIEFTYHGEKISLTKVYILSTSILCEKMPVLDGSKKLAPDRNQAPVPENEESKPK